jgi:hypothetical protein
MRHAASEKLDIIRAVGQSSLGGKRTWRRSAFPPVDVLQRYDRYVADGLDGLED